MRKPVVLTEHARFRMDLRHIAREAIESVFAHPIVHAHDTLTGYTILVGTGTYGDADRLLTVIYEEMEESIRIISGIQFAQASTVCDFSEGGGSRYEIDVAQRPV